MDQSKLWTILYVALTFALAWCAEPGTFDQSLVDLRVYYQAAQLVAAGLNPYEAPLVTNYSEHPLPPLPYIYPPLLASTLSFFVKLPFDQIARLWTIGSIVSLSGGVWFLLKMVSPASLRSGGATVALLGLLIFPPVLDGLALGQVDAFIFLLLAVAGWCLTSRQEILLGVTLAVAAGIKIIPILFILILLRYQLWTSVVAWCLTSFITFILSGFTSRGWQLWLDFLASSIKHPPEPRAFAMALNNYSLGHFLITSAPQLSPIIAWLIAAGCGALLALWLVLRVTIRRGIDSKQVYSAMVCAMLISSPCVWFHHLIWLAVPLAVAWHSRSCITAARPLTIACALVLGISFPLDSYLEHLDVSQAIVMWVRLGVVMLPTVVLCWLSTRPRHL